MTGVIFSYNGSLYLRYIHRFAKTRRYIKKNNNNNKINHFLPFLMKDLQHKKKVEPLHYTYLRSPWLCCEREDAKDAMVLVCSWGRWSSPWLLPPGTEPPPLAGFPWDSFTASKARTSFSRAAITALLPFEKMMISKLHLQMQKQNIKAWWKWQKGVISEITEIDMKIIKRKHFTLMLHHLIFAKCWQL